MTRDTAPDSPEPELRAPDGPEGDPSAKAATRAYLGIRAAILSNSLPPGSHLREETLCEMTGTSRTPVREALRRLVAEGLATEDNRHRFVTDFSISEIMVMFDMRARIEGYAARIAAERITPVEIDRLSALIAAMDAIDHAEPEAATESFLRLNGQFHDVLVEACHSTQIRIMMRPVIAAPVALIKRFVMGQPLNIRASNDQHRDILRALAAGNPDWAEMAMRAHILSTRPRVCPLPADRELRP
ncbi:GntR family transcriptional regulator [Frigidibacter sp. MR17.14]|uniref:GntR family transcriptional regulator n=1 Tax=Frigidibacter sp. MR17.14 TaxID=3126509 RepID=UPI003012B9C9